MATVTKLSPRKAKNIDDLCRMRRDSLDAGDFWILTDTYRVTIAEQVSGGSPKQSIQVPRKVFDRLVDWYMREQKLRASNQ